MDETKMDHYFLKRIRRVVRKTKKNNKKAKIIEDAKKEDVYKKVLENFPDAELVEVKFKDNE